MQRYRLPAKYGSEINLQWLIPGLRIKPGSSSVQSSNMTAPLHAVCRHNQSHTEQANTFPLLTTRFRAFTAAAARQQPEGDTIAAAGKLPASRDTPAAGSAANDPRPYAKNSIFNAPDAKRGCKSHRRSHRSQARSEAIFLVAAKPSIESQTKSRQRQKIRAQVNAYLRWLPKRRLHFQSG